MRPLTCRLILGCVVVVTAREAAYADGGSLRFSEVQGGYRISVFTAPTPFRMGPVDISVLVQDPATGQLIPSARVNVRMLKTNQHPLEVPATFEAATNKLFRAAQFEIPLAGRWKMQVEVEGIHGLATIDGDVEVAPELPRLQELWLWIGWPALAIALFGIHQVLVRHSLQRRRQEASGTAYSKFGQSSSQFHRPTT